MYLRALVTTDGSDVSRAVFPHVKQVVNPQGSVTIVEVIDDVGRLLARTTPAGFEFSTSAAFDSRFVDDMVEALRTAASGHLAQASEDLECYGFSQAEALILSGLPGDAIVQAARDRECDVVLMATHGRSGLRRAVIGSVADYVLRHLDDIPVVLIRPSDA